MKRKNKCVASKKPYKTASICLEIIRNAYLLRNTKLRYYECPVCLDFHLTSKKVNSSDFKELDREIIAKQWRHFEVLFNTVHNQVYGLGKAAKANRRKIARKRKHESEMSEVLKKQRDFFDNRRIAKKLSNQLSLAEQRQKIATMKAKVDEPRGLWTTLKQHFQVAILK